MKKHNIEDIFSSIENFSSVPPPELWDNIEEKLHPPKKKKAVAIWWAIAASLLIGLSIPSVLYFNSNSVNTNNTLPGNSVVTQEKKDNQVKNNTTPGAKKDLEKSTPASVTSGTAIVSSEKENLNPSNNKSNVSGSVSNGTLHQNDLNAKKHSNGTNAVANQDKNPNAKTHSEQNTNLNPQLNSGSYTESNLFTREDTSIVSNSKTQNATDITAKKDTFKNNAAGNSIQDKAVASNSGNNVKTNTATEKAIIDNSKNNTAGNLIKDKAVANNSGSNVKTNATTEKAIIGNSKNNTAGNSIQDKAVASNSGSNVKTNATTEKAIIGNSKSNTVGNLIQDKAVASNLKNNVKTNTATEKAIIGNSKSNTAENLIQDKAVASNLKNNVKSDSAQKAIISNSKSNTAENLIQDKAVASNLKTDPEKTIMGDSKNNFNDALIKDKAVASTTKSEISLTGEDSVQLAELQNLEKSIADSKNKKEEEPKKTAPSSEKWSLEVFAGLANSENYGKEKTLGNVNESKQTNTYGVKTNYKLNKRWAVSSGLKINELGQSIANVSYMNAKNTAFLTSTDYLLKNNTTVPQITNNSSYVFVSNNAKNSIMSSNFETGNLDQSLKYIEMPLEVSYSIFNKNKTSISLNTGGFVGKLISNDVSLNGNSIGSNVNANDFVYGSLLSSTLQYRLYKKTHVFVEPGMNYYINPLNNQSFNQFQWAFNFGLNVSF